MNITAYEQFVSLVEKYNIFPFSEFVPEHPALTAVTSEDAWHTELDSDPWLWRIRIAGEGAAAYGKFFGAKAAFIDRRLFPAVRTILTGNQSADERYNAGLKSRAAWHLYGIISGQGRIDSRQLRKEAGFGAKEDKKEYEKALTELQNDGYIVTTGAAKQDAGGWSSMCYQRSGSWVQAQAGSGGSGAGALAVEEAKRLVAEAIKPVCSEKAYVYFAKKLGLG